MKKDINIELFADFK